MNDPVADLADLLVHLLTELVNESMIHRNAVIFACKKLRQAFVSEAETQLLITNWMFCIIFGDGKYQKAKNNAVMNKLKTEEPF